MFCKVDKKLLLLMGILERKLVEKRHGLQIKAIVVYVRNQTKASKHDISNGFSLP